MICEICGGELGVKLTTPVDGKIIRERKCKDCGNVFNTTEIINTINVLNPETLRIEQVPIERVEHYRKYLMGRGNHPQHENRLWD